MEQCDGFPAAVTEQSTKATSGGRHASLLVARLAASSSGNERTSPLAKRCGPYPIPGARPVTRGLGTSHCHCCRFVTVLCVRPSMPKHLVCRKSNRSRRAESCHPGQLRRQAIMPVPASSARRQLPSEVPLPTLCEALILNRPAVENSSN